MDQQKMSKQEFLAAMAEAVKRRQAGEDPYMDPNLRRALPPKEFPQPQVAPPKPDPEREAEAAIAAAVAGRAPAVQMTPEEAQEAERREIRMQMLKEASKTGQMPEYLKKY